MEETIAWALRRLRKEVDAKLLERRRDMTSIVVPQYFNDTISKAVFNAVAASEPLVTKPQQVRKYYNAARLAYRLDTCEGLGLASSECDAELEDGPHLVFFVDLNNRLLELSIFDMDHNTCSEVVRKTLISATSRLEEVRVADFLVAIPNTCFFCIVEIEKGTNVKTFLNTCRKQIHITKSWISKCVNSYSRIYDKAIPTTTSTFSELLLSAGMLRVGKLKGPWLSFEIFYRIMLIKSGTISTPITWERQEQRRGLRNK